MDVFRIWASSILIVSLSVAFVSSLSAVDLASCNYKTAEKYYGFYQYLKSDEYKLKYGVENAI